MHFLNLEKVNIDFRESSSIVIAIADFGFIRKQYMYLL